MDPTEAPDDGRLSSNREPVSATEPPLDSEAVVDAPAVELLPAREPFRTILRGLGLLEQTVGAILLAVILVLVLAQVAQRYLPGAWPWTGELARLSLVWATFLMAGYLVAINRHIAVHLVDYVLGGRALAVVKLLVNVVILLTCLVLLYAVWGLIQSDIGQVTPAAQIPLRFVNAVPLVGLALVALRAALGIAIVDLPAIARGEEPR